MWSQIMIMKCEVFQSESESEMSGTTGTRYRYSNGGTFSNGGTGTGTGFLVPVGKLSEDLQNFEKISKN